MSENPRFPTFPKLTPAFLEEDADEFDRGEEEDLHDKSVGSKDGDGEER